MLRGAGAAIAFGVAFLVIGDTVAEDGRDRIDRSLSLRLHEQASPTLTRLMRLATDLGSATVTVPLMLLVVGLLLWRGQRRTAEIVAAFWIGAQLVDLVTKPFYHRDRPSLFPAFARAAGYSFPSGHTVTATLTYGLIAALLARGRHGWQRRLPFLAAAVIVLAVATSRVYLGVHYPSDVFGGMLIGSALVTLADESLAAHDRRRARAAPRPA